MLAHILIAASMTSGQAVVIDGQFDDWPSVDRDQPWSLQIKSDSDAIYLLAHRLGPTRVAQQLETPLKIGLDLDDNSATGCTTGDLKGSELAFILSPNEPGQRRGGVLAASWSAQGTREYHSPYEFEFLLAPSIESRRHEIRIGRSELGLTDVPIRILLNPAAGEVISESHVPADEDVTRPSTSAMPTSPDAGLRVISWNIERGGLLKRADLVSQILKELKADVLLIQELQDDQKPQDIQRVLEAAMPGSTWTISLSPRGTGLRSAVATRLTAVPAAGFNSIRRVDDPDRIVKAAGLIITTANQSRLLAVSLHLRCCGGLHGPEDMIRISEALSIREAITIAAAEHRPTSLVIGGDMNLVASQLPLTVLQDKGQAMLGEGHTGDLLVAAPGHLDNGAAYTWYDADSQFTPGQLDFILTGGDVSQAGSFIFDSTDLSSDQLGTLSATATSQASDHLPLVVDLHFESE